MNVMVKSKQGIIRYNKDEVVHFCTIKCRLFDHCVVKNELDDGEVECEVLFDNLRLEI